MPIQALPELVPGPPAGLPLLHRRRRHLHCRPEHRTAVTRDPGPAANPRRFHGGARRRPARRPKAPGEGGAWAAGKAPGPHRTAPHRTHPPAPAPASRGEGRAAGSGVTLFLVRRRSSGSPGWDWQAGRLSRPRGPVVPPPRAAPNPPGRSRPVPAGPAAVPLSAVRRRRGGRGPAGGVFKAPAMVGFAGWSAAVPTLQKPPRAGLSDGPCRYVRLIIKKNQGRRSGLPQWKKKFTRRKGDKIIPEAWGLAGWAPGELSPAAAPGLKQVVSRSKLRFVVFFRIRWRFLVAVPVAEELISLPFPHQPPGSADQFCSFQRDGVCCHSNALQFGEAWHFGSWEEPDSARCWVPGSSPSSSFTRSLSIAGAPGVCGHWAARSGSGCSCRPTLSWVSSSDNDFWLLVMGMLFWFSLQVAWLSRYKERYFKRRLGICTSSAEPPVSQPDLEGILFVEIPNWPLWRDTALEQSECGCCCTPYGI